MDVCVNYFPQKTFECDCFLSYDKQIDNLSINIQDMYLLYVHLSDVECRPRDWSDLFLPSSLTKLVLDQNQIFVQQTKEKTQHKICSPTVN